MSDWKMHREEVEKLIAAYKKLKCLWDFRSNEYKRYDLKKYSWKKLGSMFGKEAHEVKRKVKYLRSAYVSEKKKVDDSYGTGKIYRPNLFYYEDLNFLDSIIVCRKGPKFENFEQTSDTIAAEDIEQSPHSPLSEKYLDVANAVPSPSPPPLPKKKKTTESYSKIRKEKHRLAPYYSKLDAAVNTLAEVTKTTSEESIYTAFAKTVALQLTELPPIDATVTMSEIQQILSKNTIKSLMTKDSQSCKANRGTVVEHADRKLSLLTKVMDNQLNENSPLPSEFEEVSM